MNLHRSFRGFLLLALTLFAGAIAKAASPGMTPDQQAIRQVLDMQVEAWNRGDVAAFMRGYNDSPDTTFVGKTVEHGYANILARYRKKYGTREQMGRLTFSQLDIRNLDAHAAIVTGSFHLARNASAGGDAEGIFSLVFAKEKSGWKIVLDHTS